MGDGLLIVKDKKEPYWITYIKKRIENKKNFISLIYGATGSGKSWTGLSMAHQINPNFSPNRIIFGLKPMMELINGGDNFPAGTCFLWDEFQIGGGSRDWQSLTNRLLNQLLSTFRHKNYILLITAPYSDFLDSQTRKLIHAEFELKSIDYIEQKTKIKPMLLQYNGRTKKTYYKFLRVATGLGVAPIKSWKIPKAPQWLIDEYEKKKMSFTSKLNKEIEAKLNKLEPKNTTNRKLLTDKQEKVLKMLANGKDYEDIAKELDISLAAVYKHKQLAEKKGYLIGEFVEETRKNAV